jgi:hypothetical protein
MVFRALFGGVSAQQSAFIVTVVVLRRGARADQTARKCGCDRFRA